ncbi:MAG: hypothetical protein HQL53_12975 [Magnetococcales bacterium]|nr:hypothetical protein [Magnetococcales bacterium]
MENLESKVVALEELCEKQGQMIEKLSLWQQDAEMKLDQLSERNNAMLRRQTMMQNTIQDQVQQLSDRNAAVARRSAATAGSMSRRGASAAAFAKKR